MAGMDPNAPVQSPAQGAAPQPVQPMQPSPTQGPPGQGGQPQAMPTGRVAPVAQSEPDIKQPTIRIDPRPYAWLAQKDPAKRELVDTISDEAGITPQRMAAHWYFENRFRMGSDAPDSSAGAIGGMQVLPSTAKDYNNGGRLDVRNSVDNLRIGANYIRHLDDLFGRDTPASAVAYHAGEGGAKDIAAHPDDAMRTHPKSMEYVANITGMNADKLLPDLKGAAPSTATGDGVIAAGTRGGPDGVLKYLVATKGNQQSLSDAWQAAESSLQRMFIWRGDVQNAAHARDFILQMAHQGSNEYLMAGQKALAAGDSVGAATALAKAHAFFPDGSSGTFGVDNSGKVWAQRTNDSDGSAPIGQPFEITNQGIMGMLNQTADPNQFLATLMKEQAATSAAHHQSTMDDYYSGLLASREKTAALAAGSRTDAAAIRADGTVDAAALRAQSRQGNGPSSALSKAADTETSNLYGSDIDPNTPIATRGTMAEIHHDVRMNGGTPVTAERAARGITGGSLGVRQQSDGTYGVVDPKNPTAPPIAYISPGLAASISPPAPQQGGAPKSAIGLATSSPSPVSQTLAGTSQSSAVPVAQPGQGMAVPTSPQPTQPQQQPQ